MNFAWHRRCSTVTIHLQPGSEKRTTLAEQRKQQRRARQHAAMSVLSSCITWAIPNEPSARKWASSAKQPDVGCVLVSFQSGYRRAAGKVMCANFISIWNSVRTKDVTTRLDCVRRFDCRDIEVAVRWSPIMFHRGAPDHDRNRPLQKRENAIASHLGTLPYWPAGQPSAFRNSRGSYWIR
jgi:hypothetical protein